MLVYLLTPQTETGKWPIGGHYRYEVGADGKPTRFRAFSRSCLNLGGGEASGGPDAALFVSHLLDPVPTEIHVFTAYTSGTKIFVAVTSPEKRLYAIAKGRIMRVPDNAGGAGKR